MLHAVNRRKARLDVFRGAGLRVPLEDVVTSTVFGPLLFIDQAEAAAAINRLLATLGIARPDWAGPTHLELWPRRKAPPDLRSNYVEPDAEIVDAAGNSLMIEVKWRAPLGLNELAAQWLSLPPEARATSRHLLLVLETGPYAAAVASDRKLVAAACDLGWQLIPISWRRMADAFRAIGSDISLNAGTRRWALGVHGFLRREDPLSLVGWSGLEMAPVEAASWVLQRPIAQFPSVVATAWRFEKWFLAQTGPLNKSQWSFAK